MTPDLFVGLKKKKKIKPQKFLCYNHLTLRGQNPYYIHYIPKPHNCTFVRNGVTIKSFFSEKNSKFYNLQCKLNTEVCLGAGREGYSRSAFTVCGHSGPLSFTQHMLKSTSMCGARERSMAQELRALDALPQDPGWVLSTHRTAHNCL